MGGKKRHHEREVTRRGARRLSVLCAALAVLALAGGRAVRSAEKKPLRLGYIQDYKKWKALFEKPIFSESHGKRLVKTYANERALQGFKSDPPKFPPGSILVKDSWENVGGKPGKQAFLFVMKKGAPGSHPEAGDWFWAIATPDFEVLKWKGRYFSGYGGNVGYCIECHEFVDTSDYFFGKSGKPPKKKKK